MAFPETLLSQTTRSMGVSFIREMLKATKGVEGMISLAGGLPSPESFPKEQLAELFREVVINEGTDVLQYGPSEGDDLLKEQIFIHEVEPKVGNDEILITDGTTNAIYLFTRSVVDPGDVVLCEAPSFNGSLVAIEACGAELAGVPMDEEGLIVDRVRERIAEMRRAGRTVKFIYAIPEFQNP
ncbi:MAG: aminotransferase class I/II-fold pyridoxal phosphate-dependent enzyme, partial [Candidatus Aminicenantales bacterium]